MLQPGVYKARVNLMEKYFAFVILALFSLWGCAPGHEPPTNIPSDKIEPISSVPGVTKVVETAPNVAVPEEIESETMLAKPYPTQTEQANGSAPTDQAMTAIAPSGVIDLRDINQDQVTEGEGELIELPAPGVPNASKHLIETAKNDLAKRLDVNLEDVTFVAVEPKEWPDASLGCPAQDTDYLMVLVDGFQITLEVDGETYSYHTDMTGKVILCEDGQPADP